jgi:ATP-binding cassette subfamily B protein
MTTAIADLMGPKPAETDARALRSARWRRRLRRYPHISQHDETDCGAACLGMITAYYGNPVGLARLRDLASVDSRGATMWSVAHAAETLGFHARGLELGFDALSQIQLPAVVHWEDSHYVVLYEVARDHVVVCDPRFGRKRMSTGEFLAGWTRKVLELIPSTELTRIVDCTGTWRRFAPVLTKSRTALLEVLGASLVLSVLGLGIPIFTQVVIDRVLVNHSVDLLNMLLFGMLVVAVFQAAIRAVRQLILVHLSTRFDARLIGDFIRHVFRLPLRFFELRRVGDVVSRLRENEEIRHALTSTLPSVLLDSVLAVGYFALLVWYNVELTLVVAAALPFFVAIVWAFTPAIRRNQKEFFLKQSEAAAYLIEAVNGIATVKSMAVEKPVRWKLESLYVDSLVTARRAANISTAYSGLATLVQTTSAVVFLWFGAHQVVAGSMSAGQLLAFVAIAANVVTPILGLVGAWDELQTARNAVERLGDVFDAEVEQPTDETLLSPERIEGRIRFEDVSFSYREEDADPTLSGIDLEIRPGETVAIVGRSGSGKSTLLKLMLGLRRPTTGRISIDGIDLRGVSLSALRRRIGIVQQDVFLFSGTIRDNIALGCEDASLHRVVEAAKRAGAHDFIMRLASGYSTVVGERGTSLSGGQRQRLALARAMLGDPDLFLFDEATSALDTESERGIRSRMESACRDRTTVIVAHRLSTVRNADRIVVMDDGRIVEEGAYEELLIAGGLFSRLVHEQIAPRDLDEKE